MSRMLLLNLILASCVPVTEKNRDTAPPVTFDSGVDSSSTHDTVDSANDSGSPTDTASPCSDTSAYTTYYRDQDGDGYGDPANSQALCELISGYVENNDDCNDAEASAYPGATELFADGIDNDCDGNDYTTATWTPNRIVFGIPCLLTSQVLSAPSGSMTLNGDPTNGTATLRAPSFSGYSTYLGADLVVTGTSDITGTYDVDTRTFNFDATTLTASYTDPTTYPGTYLANETTKEFLTNLAPAFSSDQSTDAFSGACVADMTDFATYDYHVVGINPELETPTNLVLVGSYTMAEGDVITASADALRILPGNTFFLSVGGMLE